MKKFALFVFNIAAVYCIYAATSSLIGAILCSNIFAIIYYIIAIGIIIPALYNSKSVVDFLLDGTTVHEIIGLVMVSVIIWYFIYGTWMDIMKTCY
jgi:hypothetical protein